MDRIYAGVTETSSLLGVCPDTIRRRVRRGLIPHKRIGKKSAILIPLDWIFATRGGEDEQHQGGAIR